MDNKVTLELRSIIEAGNFDKERLTLRSTTRLDVGDYVVLQCSYVKGVLNTDVRHAFWFPYHPVDAGDLVVLYTKSGEYRKKTLSNGSSAHFFYWNLEEPIWKGDDRGAVVLLAPNWTAKQATELRG